MGGVSSHVVRLHIAGYQDGPLVRRARDILFPRKGISDKFVARNQWYAWLAAEPEFGNDYEALVEDLAAAGIEATLEDPVRFVYRAAKPVDTAAVKKTFQHPDPGRIDRSKDYLPYPGVRVDGDRIEIWSARATIDPADMARRLESAGVMAAPESHAWLRFQVDGVDCKDCLDDLVEMSGRVKGVAHARLTMEGRFEALVEKDRLGAARREVADHIEGYGFIARAAPAE